MASGIEAIGATAQLQAAALLREALPTAKIAERLLGAAKDGGVPPAVQTPVSSGGQQPAPVLGSVQMLVALAALSPAEVRRREQVALAKRGLDRLEQLHRELMEGTVNPPTLHALKQWIEGEGGDRPDAHEDDPRFARLFEDIELRVRVELAKFDIAV
ncbi:MAG: flagellar assembly protein FliX [Sphingobium sp.]